MTMFNIRPAKAVAEQMVFGNGQFVIPSGNTAGANIQIAPANMPMGLLGTPQLTAVQTISPKGTRIPTFVNPDGAQAGQALNANPLPRGVATGVTGTLGSEYLLDFSGFPGDIIFAAANLWKPSRGIATQQAYVSSVDNVNNLVYIQVANVGNTAAVAGTPGNIIAYEIAFKDTFSV